MRTRHLLTVALVAAVAPMFVVPASADPFDPAVAAASIGLRACAGGQTSAATPPVVSFVSCSGEVASFDGLELDARLTFPEDASGPVPLVLLLHGWPGDRRGWQPADDRTDVLGRARFLAEGYAVLATTARGFWASCSTLDPVADLNASGSTTATQEDPSGCVRGWTHIAEREWEVRDSQHLLGRLVDAGIADPDRLAVLGDSYGGGQAWLLATSLPWASPEGRPVRLAAAVARQGWTDLLDALAPSGREARPRPLGVLKTSIFSALWGTGRVQPWYLPGYPQGTVETSARYNNVDPAETHSFIDGWLAMLNAGESDGLAAAQYLEEALAGKSARFADDYFEAVAAGEIEPTPVMALQGWTDPLFGPAQSLRMYERLKTVHKGYPVRLALGDGGHFSLPRPEHWARLDELGVRFIVSHLSGSTPTPAPITSLRASCSTDAVEAIAHRLPSHTLLLAGAGSRTTSSSEADAGSGAQLDPVASGTRTCATGDAPAAGSATWEWAVASDGLETLGIQRVEVGYELTGVAATLIARLWDVDLTGQRRLVTSGVYRLSTLAGDATSGTVDVPLFGTHYRFEAGHRLELEFTQTDAPYLRPGTTPSMLTLSRPHLALPMLSAAIRPGPPGRQETSR